MRFEKGSVVCCLGSSITQHGYWVNDVQAFYAENYPCDKVIFLNCGVGGDTAFLAKFRLEEDVFIYHPTHVFIMFGMNDIKRELYHPQLEPTPELIAKRENALMVYQESLKILAENIQRSKMKAVFGIPAPYDTVQPSDYENYFGCADAIARCSEIVKKVAGEMACDYIDIGGAFSDLKKEWDKNGEWLYQPDRVHPTRVGYGIIAKIILKNVVFKEICLPRSFDDWSKNEPKINERIFSLEEKLRDMAYIDWGRFHPLHGECLGYEDKVQKMLDLYADASCPNWLRRSIGHYFKYACKKDLLRQEILEAKRSLS